MSFLNQISNRDALEHNYMHPRQFFGKLNNCLRPWVVCAFDMKNDASGAMVMYLHIIDVTGLGATIQNPVDGRNECVKALAFDMKLNGILPTVDELNILLETIRQTLGIKGTAKIIMG